jgi:hypothetical protein
LLHFLARLRDDLLNAARVNPSVSDQLLKRQSSDLAAHGVEPGHDHRVGRVVDDHVHAGGQLERADVAPLAPDDAPLHFIVRQGDGGDGDFRRVIGRDALHGQCDDLLGLAFGVSARALPDLAQAVGGVGARLLLHPSDELGLGLLRGHSREGLQSPALLGQHAVELGVPFQDCLFLSAELAGAPAYFLVALLQDVEFPVEGGLAFLDTPLGSFYLLATA